MRAFPVLAIVGFMGFSVVEYGGNGAWSGADASRANVAQQADFEWEGRIAAGNAIEIKNVNGSVRAVAGSGNEVEVIVTKHEGHKGDPDEVTFEVLEHGAGVTICAVYPSRDRGKPNECRSGHRGRMNIRDNDTRVDFMVRVPPRVNFVGRTVNGDVDAESLGGNVAAHTVNGSIGVSSAGYVEATTVNGSITASMGRADWTDELAFSTVNGSITLNLPSDLGVKLTAKTVNGSIDTDFPLTVRGRFSGRRLTGMIGDGGRELWLETVNGAIRLRRR